MNFSPWDNTNQTCKRSSQTKCQHELGKWAQSPTPTQGNISDSQLLEEGMYFS